MLEQIGFIGQGWIGKHYADDFEKRGYEVIRYAKDPQYEGNASALKQCEIVFIAVPTPTITMNDAQQCDISIVREVLSLIGEGNIAVIKSTIPPGTTQLLQSEFPQITVLHSPEFLREANAAYDASFPQRNIVGVPNLDEDTLTNAHRVLKSLPNAPINSIVPSSVAELVKYAGNAFLTMKVVFANVLYDLSQSLGVNAETVLNLVGKDPRIGSTHLNPLHNGRGAGGHCFIKDFAALRQFHSDLLPMDRAGHKLLGAIEFKNLTLLAESDKDQDLVMSVYNPC